MKIPDDKVELRTLFISSLTDIKTGHAGRTVVTSRCLEKGAPHEQMEHAAESGQCRKGSMQDQIFWEVLELILPMHYAAILALFDHP